MPPLLPFTFQYGEIKSTAPHLNPGRAHQFTFQYGEIKSTATAAACCASPYLHSSMERLKVTRHWRLPSRLADLHSSMERLKVINTILPYLFCFYLHSSMERLKGWLPGHLPCRCLHLHSSMERLKVIMTKNVMC